MECHKHRIQNALDTECWKCRAERAAAQKGFLPGSISSSTWLGELAESWERRSRDMEKIIKRDFSRGYAAGLRASAKELRAYMESSPN